MPLQQADAMMETLPAEAGGGGESLGYIRSRVQSLMGGAGDAGSPAAAALGLGGSAMDSTLLWLSHFGKIVRRSAPDDINDENRAELTPERDTNLFPLLLLAMCARLGSFETVATYTLARILARVNLQLLPPSTSTSQSGEAAADEAASAAEAATGGDAVPGGRADLDRLVAEREHGTVVDPIYFAFGNSRTHARPAQREHTARCHSRLQRARPRRRRARRRPRLFLPRRIPSLADRIIHLWRLRWTAARPARVLNSECADRVATRGAANRRRDVGVPPCL